MKQHSELQVLLDRYWEGISTLEEERRLKQLFRSGNFPAELEREAQLFLAFQTEREVQYTGPKKLRTLTFISSNYARIAAAIILLLAAAYWFGSSPKVAPADAPVVQIKPKTAPVEPVAPASAITEAASPTLLAQTTTTPVSKNRVRNVRRNAPKIEPEPATSTDSYEDPEQALAEIKAVLALVSSKINKTRREVDKGLQEIDNVDILLKKKKETAG